MNSRVGTAKLVQRRLMLSPARRRLASLRKAGRRNPPQRALRPSEHAASNAVAAVARRIGPVVIDLGVDDDRGTVGV